jgi:hypothetical protein
MKAYDIMIFFIMLNTSFFVLNSMGIWVGPGSPFGTPALITYLTASVIGGFLGWIVSSAVVYLYGSRLSSPDIVALQIFAFIYGIMVGIGNGILASLYVPGPIVMVIGGIEMITLFIAIVQMAGKVSFKLMD